MKTLGILETDVLYDDLIADYRSYGHLFVEFFTRLGLSLNYRFYQVQQGEFPQQGDCDAYLITGSKAGVYDPLPWIPNLQQWITRAFSDGEKMIGVCFGHQIIAHTLGGFAGKSPKGWGVGLHVTQLGKLPTWLDDTEPTLELIYSHQDQVERLPTGATLLAGSTFCNNASFCIGQQVLTFQGHPEFTVEYTRRLLGRRAAAIGNELLQERMNNLREAQDAQRAGRWMAALIGVKTLATC